MATETMTALTLKSESISINSLSYTASSQLLDLPAEIRNEIYTHLFRDAKLGIATVHTESRHPICGSFCDCAFPWHIVNTCRQIRQEAMAVLLAATTLEVTSRVDKASLLPEYYFSSIPRAIFLDAKLLPMCPIQLNKFQALESLELRNVTVWCKYYEESYLLSDDANETMFDLAMFNLGRINPNLVKVCQDQSRTFRVLLGCVFVVSSSTHGTITAVIDVDTKEVLQKTSAAGITVRNAWAGFY